MSQLLINQYYKDLGDRKRYGGSKNEGSLRSAFGTLLNAYCRSRDFLLIEELYIKSKLNTNIRLDGIVKDALRLDWGYWEAKDIYDSLDQEIEDKLRKGYPDDNILFEDSETAVLYQHSQEVMRISMKDRDALEKMLNLFLDYERPEVKDFRQAINSFKEDLPVILDTLRNIIKQESTNNFKFQQERDKFLQLCQGSINPDLNIDDIREMMIQHILTEDIFINIFNEGQFHQENNIAQALHNVIETFFTGKVKKNTLKTINSYYAVIIRTAGNINNHHEKQQFLKKVYEEFYKAYNPLAADRLGIVYTPNEIVKFMIESTDYLVHKHFNKLLGDTGVEILDPATGTGTFITELIEYLPDHQLNSQLILSLYRPFTKQYLYFDKHFNGRTYQWFNIYDQSDKDNKIITFQSFGSNRPFNVLATNCIAELHVTGANQCLPLYTYDEDGNKVENITDWGLERFREHYQNTGGLTMLNPYNEKNNEITKEDIFHYTYAVLHNPKYREKYELNLKREFPRIPFYDDFFKWVNWGKQLMELHLNYETITPYQLTRIDSPLKAETKTPKVKLKADKNQNKIIIDEITTLEKIPSEVWQYKLGNRTAIEWILDQYKEKKPKDKTIAENFNNYRFSDYKEQVIDLLMRVCTVSLETIKIIQEME